MTAARHLDVAIDAGAPGSDSRRSAIANLMQESAVRSFKTTAGRGVMVSESAAAATRTIMLALVAGCAFAMDRAFGDDLAVSAAIAILVFVAVDQLFVDRILEPWLEGRRFKRLLNACSEVIQLCEGIEVMPHHFAALFDGVVLNPDPPPMDGKPPGT